MLDLSALSAPSSSELAAKANGEPLLIPLVDIEVDPEQPRKTFDPVKMAELTATVKEVGVISPVSVVAHPDKPGKWILHYGERRYRASLEAGLETIPAFVRQRHDKYEQVIENLQREGLTAMELAMFIDLRLKAGDKKAGIAKNLGVDAAVVTNHLALIDAPPSIDALYNSGRCTSARVIYDLRTLHKSYPAEVDAFCDANEDVTRAAVLALAAQLKSATKAAQPPSEAGDATKPAAPNSLVRTKEPEEGGGNDASGDGKKPAPSPAPPTADDGQGDTSGAGAGGSVGDAPEGTTSWPRGKAVADPDLMKRPLLMVRIDGRSAAVLLNRRPTTVGLVHVCYENGEKAEVSATDCVLDTLTDEEA
ncbi:ParB/RepB/Spo0J family partition protein (plasmid) [Agrobacterium sp. rho-13.3]|uniref:ParB/RepB/Spo0J family partition protein n=1 Tax=Agrobacterium sp. rho-13.3 TaxID=3072980 RepID=UPI002A162404|nr:ParB/RepB/Spo0J family partition protein [Agrobacterium sp. rho-13.3]MDX8311579.1 ParB/RepB/Spo0J family partition protein [Agrobacterium sp. rho-13.3]